MEGRRLWGMTYYVSLRPVDYKEMGRKSSARVVKLQHIGVGATSKCPQQSRIEQELNDILIREVNA